MQLRVATCATLPEPDSDEPLLMSALRRAGIDAELCGWDTPAVDWGRSVPTLLRSTWNYHWSLNEFLTWCERAGRAAPLWNAPSIVRKNAHKRYLLELEAWGVGVVPTELLERNGARSLDGILERRGWSRWVIKPAVSAGSFGTRVFETRDLEDARAHLESLLQNGDVLVQPYMTSVEGHGERCLVWIDGEFTHAVRKAPRFVGDAESVTGPVAMESDELRVARAAMLEWSRLAPQGSPLLYGRVDLVRDERGEPRVAEVELIEPSLFFERSPAALARFVSAVKRRLRAL